MNGRLTVGEAADRLGLSPVTVRGLFRTGRLTGRRRRIGPWDRIYIDPESVARYDRERREVRRRPSRATLARALAVGIVGAPEGGPT